MRVLVAFTNPDTEPMYAYIRRDKLKDIYTIEELKTLQDTKYSRELDEQLDYCYDFDYKTQAFHKRST